MPPQSEPTNKNFLSPVGFKFSIERLPNVNWFIQSATLPGVTLGVTDVEMPGFVSMNLPGETMVFDNLDVRFKVDEDLANWEEVQNWIVGLGSPEDFEKYSGLIASIPGQDARYSDATLSILNSNMRANYEIRFKDLYPVALSSLNFDSTASDIDYLTADVTFRYLLYNYKKI